VDYPYKTDSFLPNTYPPTQSQSPNAIPVISPPTAAAPRSPPRPAADFGNRPTIGISRSASDDKPKAEKAAPEVVKDTAEKVEKGEKARERKSGPQWPPATENHSRFKVLFPEIYCKPQHSLTPSITVAPANGMFSPHKFCRYLQRTS
jgi:hypothetical protein